MRKLCGVAVFLCLFFLSCPSWAASSPAIDLKETYFPHGEFFVRMGDVTAVKDPNVGSYGAVLDLPKYDIHIEAGFNDYSGMKKAAYDYLTKLGMKDSEIPQPKGSIQNHSEIVESAYSKFFGKMTLIDKKVNKANPNFQTSTLQYSFTHNNLKYIFISRVIFIHSRSREYTLLYAAPFSKMQHLPPEQFFNSFRLKETSVATPAPKKQPKLTMMCGVPVKNGGIVMGLGQVSFKEKVIDGGKKLFPKSKTVTMFYDNMDEGQNGYADCNELFDNFIKNKRFNDIMCVDFYKRENDLGIEGLGIRDKYVYWIEQCAVPN